MTEPATDLSFSTKKQPKMQTKEFVEKLSTYPFNMLLLHLPEIFLDLLGFFEMF